MRAPTPDKNGVRWYGNSLYKQQQIAGRCIAEVSDNDPRATRYFQCSHKATHGDYCKRHAPPTGKEVWWRVSSYNTKAEMREFAGSTDSQLINSNGRREAKSNRFYCYYPSELQALEAIEVRILIEIEQHNLQLRELGNSLASVQTALRNKRK